jgi:hypothetical protein
MSLQTDKDLPEKNEDGAPLDGIPPRLAQVVPNSNTGSEARVVTLENTRSLRDRGKEKGEDGAAISYTKVNSRSQRSGRSRWT